MVGPLLLLPANELTVIALHSAIWNLVTRVHAQFLTAKSQKLCLRRWWLPGLTGRQARASRRRAS